MALKIPQAVMRKHEVSVLGVDIPQQTKVYHLSPMQLPGA